MLGLLNRRVLAFKSHALNSFVFSLAALARPVILGDTLRHPVFSFAGQDHLRVVNTPKRMPEFLKAMAHESRMMLLCYLSTGQKTVTELEELLTLRQTAGTICGRS